MAKKVTTLYIDDTSLRLLVAKGAKVKKWANLPLESGLVKDGTILDEAKLAAKIRQLLKTQKVSTQKVIVGLSGLHCLSRVVTLPHLSRAMRADAVKQEAKRALPVPLEQLYISWQIIHASGEELQVFIVALPRNTADALIKTLQKANVKPYLIDLKPLALARVVKEATAVIIDVQPTEFDIVIMVDGVPQPIRSLPFPSEGLSMQEELPIIREELERTIKLYNSSYPEKPLELSLPIFVSGKLADKPKLCKSLSNEFGTPVLPLESPLKCPEDLASSQYMVNIGLALKELSPGKGTVPSVVNLNVLPEVYQPKAPSLTRILATTGIIMAIGLLIPLVMLVQNTVANTALLQDQLDTTNQFLKQKHTQQQSQKQEIAGQERKIAGLEANNNAFTAVLNNFGSQQEVVNSDLEVTTSTLPSDVNLINIAHADAGLTITGVSPTEIEVLTYASDLRASGRFAQVVVSSMAITDDGVRFTLTLGIGREG